MQTFTFDIRFRFDSAQFYETSFQLSLNEEEITFVKSFIKENGENMPFWAFEFENEALFNRMLEAQVAAILSYVNREIVAPGDVPFTEETVSWDYVLVEFYWPEELK